MCGNIQFDASDVCKINNNNQNARTVEMQRGLQKPFPPSANGSYTNHTVKRLHTF